MTTQKAVLLPEKFGEFVLGDTKIPTPGPGEVLIRVKSVGLNPVDWKIQRFGIYANEFPAILGLDIAGDIEEIGEGVTNLQKGDRVFTHGGFENDHNGFQQLAKADPNLLAKIPDGFSYDDAATLPTALTTAYLGLYNIHPIGLGLTPLFNPGGKGAYVDTPLVINGGSSSVGQLVIQFAKASGFNPIITIASSKHNQHLTSLGATHVIDRHASPETIIEEIRKISKVPVRAIYDAVGGDEIQKALLELLPPEGNFVYTAGLNADTSGKTVSRVFSMRTYPANAPYLPTLWANASALLSDGTIQPLKAEVLPGGLAGVPDGLKRLEKGVSGIKLVAHPNETP
ncbi:biotin/lipoyl attachment:Carbamoyl-phosphate synthase subunit L [Coprinopsis cinerea AmutBmut pab1-1]|nr:biotin/lipoyl attachment:Carbamoyl-phosphate synthase subunit L [Coprinopsis cinerea AmutBmut pab1-1]